MNKNILVYFSVIIAKSFKIVETGVIFFIHPNIEVQRKYESFFITLCI